MNDSLRLAWFWLALFCGGQVVAQQTTLLFQPTATTQPGEPAFVRMTGTRFTTTPVSPTAWTTEANEVYVRTDSGSAFLDFPYLVGTAVPQIPPGRRVASATLELYCTRASGPIGLTATSDITAFFVTDPDRLGTWHEPAQAGNQVLRSGVTWVERDARVLWRDAVTPNAIPWDSARNPRPTTNATGTVPGLPASSNPMVRVNLANASGTIAGGTWHTFNVTAHVRQWVESGRSNQGWLINGSGPIDVWYASDEWANASQRPRLRIILDPNTVATTNRVPEIAGTFPPVLGAPAGGEIAFVVVGVDADGTTPEIILTESPTAGTLTRVGNLDAWIYRADPLQTGTFFATFIARDAISASHPVRIPIVVAQRPQAITAIYQEGVHPVNGLSLGATKSNGTLAGLQTSGFGNTYAQEELVIQPASSLGFGRQAFVAFPQIVGAGSGRIPPGARVLSATLSLVSKSIPRATVERRVLEARRIIDPFGLRRDWREVPGVLTAPGVVSGQAVSFRSRDESAIPIGSLDWEIPGGNAHPGEAASFATENTDPTSDGTYRLDVTQAVQAWALGEPNYGWVLRAAGPHRDPNSFWSDDAPVAAKRPQLVVHYLPPGTAPSATPLPPRADAGPDQVVFTRELVTLDARGSASALGLPRNPPALLWLQTAGPLVTLSNPSASRPTFLAPSTPTVLRFVAVAIDVGGTLSADEVQVQVLAQPGGTNINPVVAYGGGNRTVDELAAVTLNGQVLANGGGTRTVRWTQLFGPPVIDPSDNLQLSFSFQAPPVGATPMDLVFDLSVEESHSSGYVSRSRDEVVITIRPTNNRAPIANAGVSRTVEPLDWIEIDASRSSDPDLHPLLFTWRQIAGPTVDLTSYVPDGTSTSARRPIQIPSVASSTIIVLEVSVTDRELVGTARLNLTVQPPPTAFTGSITVSPLSPYRDQLHPREAQHLLRRMGGGWHPDDVTAVRAAGLSATVQSMIAMDFVMPMTGQRMKTPFEVQEEAFQNAPLVFSSTATAPVLNQPLFDDWPQFSARQGTAAWLTHAFRSPNILAERMASFWHHRLAVSIRDLPLGLRQAIPPLIINWREKSLSRYDEVLDFFLHDEVTLSFIDGFNNLRFAPNENLAREFFELHTLGVNDLFSPNSATRHFNQADIVEAARAMTGWRPVCYTLTGTSSSCYRGFVPFFHDNGVKTVLGQTGNFVDVDLIQVVMSGYQNGRAAARFLAMDLLRTFVMSEPPLSLIDELATVILAEDWQMAPVVRRILISRAMFAPEARKSIVKSPLEFANGIVRTLRLSLQTTDIASYGSLAGLLTNAGEEVLNPLDVDGWPEDLAWISDDTLVQRLNMLDRLLELAISPRLPSINDRVGMPTTPIQLIDPWLPPPLARRSAEVAERVARLLDIDLQISPAGGAAQSEFDLVREYLDTRAIIPQGSPQTVWAPVADPLSDSNPNRDTKLLGLLTLFLEHPDFQRL